MSKPLYLGALFIALIVASTVVALLRRHGCRVWPATIVLAAAVLLGCVVSRSMGLPGATDDIGNWLEALGLASLFIDGVLVLLGVSAFTEHLPVRRQAGERSVDDV